MLLYLLQKQKKIYSIQDLHNKDIGHTLIIGPTGAGKSFLLSMTMTNFLKYEGKVLDEFGKEQTKPAQNLFF